MYINIYFIAVIHSLGYMTVKTAQNLSAVSNIFNMNSPDYFRIKIYVFVKIFFCIGNISR